MISLDVTVEGEQQLSRRLLLAADGLENFKEPLTNSVSELKKSFDQNFDARGGLFGGWAPRKDNNPWPLLERSGTMRNSFTDEIFKDYAIIGNSAPQFPYHQSNKPRSKLPRRVMMMLDAQRKLFIVKEFQEYIVKQIRK